MKLIRRCSLIVTFLMLFSVAGVAGSFSFIGNFVDDNDVQLFSFTLLAPGTITVQTWGYGGGTNAAGMLIAPGGFEPLLNMFNAPSGISVGGVFNPASPCAPRNVDPNLLPVTLCLDAFGQMALPAGDYFLSLTQSDNDLVDQNLGDGFFFTDAVPDPAFRNHFVGKVGDFQRDSHWAVDILSVDAASQIGGTTPEPASAALVAGALVLAGFWRRRLNRL